MFPSIFAFNLPETVCVPDWFLHPGYLRERGTPACRHLPLDAHSAARLLLRQAQVVDVHLLLLVCKTHQSTSGGRDVLPILI